MSRYPEGEADWLLRRTFIVRNQGSIDRRRSLVLIDAGYEIAMSNANRHANTMKHG